MFITGRNQSNESSVHLTCCSHQKCNDEHNKPGDSIQSPNNELGWWVWQRTICGTNASDSSTTQQNKKVLKILLISKLVCKCMYTEAQRATHLRKMRVVFCIVSNQDESNDSGEIWERLILSPSRCAKSIWWWWKNWGIIWKMRLQKLRLFNFNPLEITIRVGWNSWMKGAWIYVNCRWAKKNKKHKNRVPFIVVPVAHALNDWRVRSTSE